jgi:chemotaxis protein CheZ
MARPYRVEIAQARHLAEKSPMSQQVDHILRELHTLRSQVNAGGQQHSSAPVDNAIALWSGVDDIQKRIEVTKSEISALRDRGVADPEQGSRTAEELRAVVTGTESATDTILAAAERIDAVVQPLQASADESVADGARVVAECVVQIFEACNFQDITGQRISKVVDSLQFIEQRIASMIDVWKTLDLGGAPAGKAEERKLLNGPALEGDRGVVSQDDVDALFG